MYPEPEVCLNLPAWQEFCGFDKDGQNAWFDIGIDMEKRAATFRKAGDAPFAFGRQLSRLHMLMDPEEVQRVPAAEGVPCDLAGEARTGETALPGPFVSFTLS